MVYLEFDDEAWYYYYWIVLIGALFSFVGLMSSCVCGCRRNENKSEFGGLAGMVTITHPDNEGFNRLSTPDTVHALSQDTTDFGKRISGANRSLPDIPKVGSTLAGAQVEALSQGVIYETNEVICDPSELYATVEEKNSVQLHVADARCAEKELQGSLQQSSLTHQATSPYARLKNGVVQNDEHPYAQVHTVQKTELKLQNRNNVGHLVDTSLPSSASSSTDHTAPYANPIAPPRARRSPSHNSLITLDSLPDIQAANAITGGVQANQDLPYMTPPILMPLPEPPQSIPNEGGQQHFSGDSHDSKGYTSISVREPLANIIAQTKAAQQQRQEQRALTDPHYATVSDDSDEMYAAIDEQEKVYTSGSETYAQIQPMAPDPVRVQQVEQLYSAHSLCTDELHASAPQPPSVDSLRHVAHAHSRQASSSSATSSVANLGSPKPEKRQANSPLPPPPEFLTDVYALIEKRDSKNDHSKISIAPGKSLEDMYAKVVKKKRDEDEKLDVLAISTNNHHTNIPSLNRKHSLVDFSRASWSSHDSIELQKKDLELLHFIVGNPSTSFHNEVDRNPLKISSKQSETVTGNSGSDPGYEAVDVNHKNIAVVRRVPDSDPDYEVLRPQFSRDNNDQESLVDFQQNGIDVFPMYSSPFKHRQISNASSEDPGYERVRMTRRIDIDQDTDSEPNYESMPHDSGEPNYASVCRPGDSDTDPNYESVSHSDPNYESVKYLTVTEAEDPPYEQVSSYIGVSNPDDYEIVRNKNTDDPNYEKIQITNVADSTHDAETDDEQYIQV